MDISRKPILETIYKCMVEDPNIVIMGEGAKLKASYDYPPLLERFGRRIFTAPICEGGLINMALGAAVCGMRPIVDVTFDDLLLRAMDEILNEVAKIHLMSGGKLHARMVIHADFTKYECSQAGNHYDYLFAQQPPPRFYERDGGSYVIPPTLTVCTPKTVKESVEMMYEALHYDGPTLFFEDRLMQD